MAAVDVDADLAARGVARIRRGAPADTQAVLALFDEALDWLVERGQGGPWSAAPFSHRSSTVARIAE
jgi:hypothetical protein